MFLYDKVMCIFFRLSMYGLDRSWHITRYSMYKILAEVGKNFEKKKGNVLSISHSKTLCEVMGFEPVDICELNYPDGNMLSLPYKDNSFDFVCSDQVLEHVAGNPQSAIDECWRVLRPGGVAVHTTCFINPIHNEPADYWRFTPDALRLLSSKFNLVLSCDGWGNFEAWSLIRKGMRFDGVPNAKWHPFYKVATKNDHEWPIVTWIVAVK